MSESFSYAGLAEFSWEKLTIKMASMGLFLSVGLISQHDTTLLLPRVIEAGGQACLDKGLLASELLASIRRLREID